MNWNGVIKALIVYVISNQWAEYFNKREENYINRLLKNTIDLSLIISISFSIISCIHSCLTYVYWTWRLTFLLLIILKLKKKKTTHKIVFWDAIFARAEHLAEYRRRIDFSSLSILSTNVSTTIFWLFLLKIIATQNVNFRCVRLDRYKERKK